MLLTDPAAAARRAGFGKGELLTLGCAVAFAAHVVILGETAHRHDPIRLATVQVAVVGAAARSPGSGSAATASRRPPWPPPSPPPSIATALAFVLQVCGQATVPPARAAVLLLVEPVFAALLATVTGDPLRPSSSPAPA